MPIEIQSRANGSIVLSSKNPVGIVESPPVLDRPVSLLADHVRKATSAFFTIQENMTSNKKVPKSFLAQVRDGKHVFRGHCEAMRRVLQSSCRHAVDYATSSQSAPDDRFMSAKRCFLSAKGIYREVLELSRAYEVTVVDFNKQRSLLSAYPTAHAKNAPKLQDESENNGIVLYAALEGIQTCLQDVGAFWEYHVGFLALLVNRQTNYPSPGAEAKATFELWTEYRLSFVKCSNSILESSDALSMGPAFNLSKGKQTVRFWGSSSLSTDPGRGYNRKSHRTDLKDRIERMLLAMF